MSKIDKQTCQECWAQVWLGENLWTKIDDRDFLEGMIECPLAITGGLNSFRKKLSQPPEHCPYVLEHLMRCQDADQRDL